MPQPTFLQKAPAGDRPATGGYGQKVLDTIQGSSRAWDRGPEDLAKFPFGKLKGKWVGMTKEQLAALSK